MSGLKYNSHLSLHYTDAMTKHILSVSLGSSARDFCIETERLGQHLLLERRGVDGDMQAAAELIQRMDGKVAAFGLGGIDLYLYLGERRYTLRDAQKLARVAKQTPVVCGAGLKRSLEQQVIGSYDWQAKRVLMTSAVDRYGMASAFVAAGAEVLLGDCLFSLNIPLPLYSLRTLQALALGMLPVLTRLPFHWLYPTGSAQLQAQRPRFGWAYRWAEVIAGDWHYIKKYAPNDLEGKIIVTNTTTTEDVAWLRQRGVVQLITTTPRVQGRSLPTNVLEAAMVALAGRFPLEQADYQQMIASLGLQGDSMVWN